jgi:hypothetical protein
MWKEIAYPEAAFTPLAKIPWAAKPDPICRGLGTLGDRAFTNCLALMLLQHGLGVKGIHMAGSAIHKAENNVPCPGRMMMAVAGIRQNLPGKPSKASRASHKKITPWDEVSHR